jgi:hypothetical protein
LSLAVEVTAVKVFVALSTSVSVSEPVATGVPGVVVPASVTEPAVAPEMTAASLVPLMAIVKVCWAGACRPTP